MALPLLSSKPNGTIVTYGGKQWIVIATNRLLLVSGQAFDMAFDTGGKIDFAENTSLRSYLNGSFYNSLINKEWIVPSNFRVEYDTGQFIRNVTDNVGLLSVTEFNSIKASLPSSGAEGIYWWTTSIVSLGNPYVMTIDMNGNAFGQDPRKTTGVKARPVIQLKPGLFVTDNGSVTNNTAPTLALTSPSNNLTLSEGSSYPLEGSATDADPGNVVTVKYQINNGPVRALQSGVSDGNTPISFARTLTYRNKRIWDASIDVIGADLAENTDHFLKVWAEDDQGGKSAEVTRAFRVLHNRPPVISGQDENLGTINIQPNKTYFVNDLEGQSFTIEEYLDGQLLRSFPGVANTEYTITIPLDKWLRTSLTQHSLKIKAIDSAGLYSERIYTFTRTDDRIEFELKQPFPTDAKANRILFTLDAVIPAGAVLLVEACNNAFDALPTYEEITGKVTAGRGHIFQNQVKTAANWGINARVRILKGSATEPIIINGFGGAFD